MSGEVKFLDDLMVEHMDRNAAQFFAKSGSTRPTAVSHPRLKEGDKLTEPDTGNELVFYDGRWHLKVLGTYAALKYTLTFDKGLGASVDPATKEVTYDQAYGDLATAVYTGYSLAGWYLDEELTEEIAAEDDVTIEANATVYPKYTPIQYPIAYNLDDGANDPLNPAAYTIETPTITLEDAVKEGYTFDGWFSDAGLTTEVTEIALGSTGDVTLYAKFTIIE